MKSLILAVLLAAFSVTAVAQTNVSNFEAGVERRTGQLEVLEQSLSDNGNNLDLLDLREELREVRDEAISASDPLRNILSQVQGDIERLGPAPKEGETEADDIASTRRQLTARAESINGQLRQSDLNLARANRLLSEITAQRQKEFYSNLFEGGDPPFLKSVWGAAFSNLLETQANLPAVIRTIRPTATTQTGQLVAYGLLGFSVLLGLVVFIPVRRWLEQTFLRKLETRDATPRVRNAMAGGRMLSRVLPGIIGGGIVFAVARSQGFISETLHSVALTLWIGVVVLLIIDGLATAVFSPKRERWRIAPLDTWTATRVRFVLMLIGTLLLADVLLTRGGEVLGATVELSRLQSSIVALLGAGLLYYLSRSRTWNVSEERAEGLKEDNLKFWKRARRGGRLIAIVSALAALAGYVALSHFLITRVFYLAGAAYLLWFVRAMFQAVIGFLSDRDRASNVTENNSEPAERQIFFWLGILVDFSMLVIAIPFLMVLLGFEWLEVRDWVSDAFFGFQVGSVRISISQILSAIVAFIFILTLTGFVQRGVENRFFSNTRADSGVRDSIRTLLGYIGLVIALLSAIALLGVNLASFAIVAGALSLGIGFGLQSIVNNFVSGLILLFERPIKIGDWIEVTSGQGIVKRISVRSTEIETFDRSTIVVPNSELISSSVTNWTHGDDYTRVIIPVGVSYSDNPRQVVEILQKVMKENKRVLGLPEPVAFFAGFGDSSLDFEMRLFINKISDRIPVQTELRIAVFEAFAEVGIEIPFPQRDLHIKTRPDELETILTQKRAELEDKSGQDDDQA